ncbi:MAG: hypothetical protein OFPII_10120 [Osedax symbiont Rs1]|nr:MAG: hypothetical protein OFPII_10120 [Osedax symbiont Rs1]
MQTRPSTATLSNQLTLLKVKQGVFTLHRYPVLKKEQLRAWDAADELIVDYLNDQIDVATHKPLRVLIVNDQFGALSTVLNAYSPTMFSDSYIAQQATQANLAENNLAAVHCINSTQELVGFYDLVIIKIQKSLAQLEDQLHKIRPHLQTDSIIIGAAMVKMLHTSNLNLFEKIIGPTTTSLAKKKARLIFSDYQHTLNPADNPYPQSYFLESQQWNILNHANVFSRAKLDIGCRYFLENIPSSQHYHKIVDLGCGNGLVGLMAAQLNPQAQIDFYDESYMAIASAEHNFKQIFNDRRAATFNVADCLTDCAAASVDLILNNPPFHQQNAIGDFIARQMFKQSFTALKPKGELWVIGNRHLDYPQILKNIFNNCQQVTANKKFVILRAVKNS